MKLLLNICTMMRPDLYKVMFTLYKSNHFFKGKLRFFHMVSLNYIQQDGK